jgi:CheY-like chemotaxis protein
MDLRMPGMNGLEATEAIRKRWPDRRTKILALTAFALQGDRERCLAAGMDDYISKPVRMDELKRLLKKHC